MNDLTSPLSQSHIRNRNGINSSEDEDKGGFDGRHIEMDDPHDIKIVTSRSRFAALCRSYKRLIMFVTMFIIAAMMVTHSYYNYQADCKGCMMSYMRPRYIEQTSVRSRFSKKYALYLYREGGYDYGKDPFRIPILFIPGNAGSYKQARSLGSATTEMFAEMAGNDPKTLIDEGKIGFDFFTIHLNEEFTALHGYSMLEQAEYINDVIAYIISLYQGPRSEVLGVDKNGKSIKFPHITSVTVVGHSMGGMVARTAPTLKNYVPNSINTLITLSTPHNFPPAALETNIDIMYQGVNSYWKNAYNTKALENVTVVSIVGGNLDGMINSDFAYIGDFVPPSNGFTVFSTGIPDAWVAPEHQTILWCRQLVHKLGRVLISVSDARLPEQAKPVEERMELFRQGFAPKGYDLNYKQEFNGHPIEISQSEFNRSTVIANSQHSDIAINKHNIQKHLPTLFPLNEGSDDAPTIILFEAEARGDIVLEMVYSSDLDVMPVMCRASGNVNLPGTKSKCYELPTRPPVTLPISYRLKGTLAKPQELDYIGSISTKNVRAQFPSIFSTSDDKDLLYLGVKVDSIRKISLEDKFIRMAKRDETPQEPAQIRIRPTNLLDLFRGSIKVTIPMSQSTIRSRVHIDIDENPVITTSAKLTHIPRDVSDGIADDSLLWPTIVRQSDNRQGIAEYESKFWTIYEDQDPNFDIAFHGRGAYRLLQQQSNPTEPSSLSFESGNHWGGLDIDIWADSTKYKHLELEFSINWYSSFNRIVKRYDMVGLSFPFIWVIAMFLQQLSVWNNSNAKLSPSRESLDRDNGDSTSRWIPIMESLEIVVRRSGMFWGLILSIGLLTIVQNVVVSLFPSQIGSTGYWWKMWIQNLIVGYRGSEALFPAIIVMGLATLSFGLVICECIVILVVTVVLAYALKLVMRLWKQQESKADASNFAQVVQESSILHLKELVKVVVFLGLVTTVIPYHFIFLALLADQLITLVRMYAMSLSLEDNQSIQRDSKYRVLRQALLNRINYQMSILLLWLQIIPFCVPELLVWFRNLGVQWFEDAGSDHYVSNILGFYLLRLVSNHSMFPKTAISSSFASPYQLTKLVLVGSAIYTILVGARQPYMLYYVTHMISFWFVGLYFYAKITTLLNFPSSPTPSSRNASSQESILKLDRRLSEPTE